MKKFIGTALVLCCLALPLAGCEDAISTVTSTTMSELEDIPNQILATPESAETEPEYNLHPFSLRQHLDCICPRKLRNRGQRPKHKI